MNAKPQISRTSPLDKPKLKSSSKRVENTFKIITPSIEASSKKNSERLIYQISATPDLSLIKFNPKNDSSSTTTHSSNNIPYKQKQEHSNSKPKTYNHSHSPINYQDLKLEKEAGGTPGKIKNNLSSKKKNIPVNWNNNTGNVEKKFEDLCHDDLNYLKNSENIIIELKKQNKRLKVSEKKFSEKVEILEKENQELRAQLKSKSFFDKFMRSSTNSNNKPLMFDAAAQVFLEEESFDIDDKTLLISQLAMLEEKINSIENGICNLKPVEKKIMQNESNSASTLIIKANVSSEQKKNFPSENNSLKTVVAFEQMKNTQTEGNFKELENSLKELFLKNRNLELLYQETKNERDTFHKLLQDKKCTKCQQEEENYKKGPTPIPGYLKLLRLGQEVRNKI